MIHEEKAPESGSQNPNPTDGNGENHGGCTQEGGTCGSSGSGQDKTGMGGGSKKTGMGGSFKKTDNS